MSQHAQHSAVSSEERSALAVSVTGSTLLPGDDGFAEETAPFNLSVTHRPAIAVGAESASDIQAAVRFAAERRRPVTVLATGHGPGLAAGEDSVLINTRRMTGVAIDQEAGTARVEAGVRWRQVVDEAARFGLAPLAGSSPTVGVVGYTLGGGISVTMGRAKGWAADHVRSIDVVTADGRLRHASANSEQDLFWALRGSKSNLGVVTALEFALFPVTHLYAGGLYYAGEHMDRVLRAYRDVSAQAPEELMSSIALYRLPDAPHVAGFMRGRLIVNIRVSYLGSERDGESLIAPLRTAAPLVEDTVRTRPYTEFAEISPGPTEPVSYVDHFRLLNTLSDESIDALVRAVGPDSGSGITIVDIRQLGGALERTSGATAIRNHGAPFVIFTMSMFAPGQQIRSDAGMELLDGLRPWLNKRLHPNFLAAGAATVEQVRTAFDPPTYERLQTVKAAYDPGNMFRLNHNVPPKPAG